MGTGSTGYSRGATWQPDRPLSIHLPLSSPLLTVFCGFLPLFNRKPSFRSNHILFIFPQLERVSFDDRIASQYSR